MKKIFFTLCVFFAPILSGARNVYLVSVGVADYPGISMDLTLPANDAKAMNTLYRTNADATTILLTNKNATRQNIMTKTRNLFARAGKDDIVVFFFSGHGYPGGFVAYDEYLTYDDVRGLFSACKATNKMIFADACFAGDIREPGTSNSSRKEGVMLFLSSRDDETSIENPRMRNGFFTACLVRCLKGGADANRDRIITARELFEGVSAGVRDLSDNRQHPVMWGNFSNNMVVMSW